MPDIGYKVKGFYNKNGKKLTAYKSYSMNPTSGSYNVVFSLDPNSYKYTLQIWQNADTYKPYNLAAQKRLKELGYYQTAENGIFDEAMRSAVIAFQADYNLEANGIIDEPTWALLFTENPKPIQLPDEKPEPDEGITDNTPDVPDMPSDSSASDVIVSDSKSTSEEELPTPSPDNKD